MQFSPKQAEQEGSLWTDKLLVVGSNTACGLRKRHPLLVMVRMATACGVVSKLLCFP